MTIEKLLAKLVSTNSVYPHEEKIGGFIFSLLEKNGLHPKKQLVSDKRYNIITEKGAGKKTVLLYGHLDTVGLVPGWTKNPFHLTIEGDKAYGLGAWDMKGGMAVNIHSFLNFQPKNIKTKLVLCVDEENISEGSHVFISSKEKQGVVCSLHTEPAFRFGLRGIVQGRIGRAVFVVTFKGKSRHVAYYRPEFDTNLLVAEFLMELHKLTKNYGHEKKQTLFARKIHSEAIAMSIPQQTVIEVECAIVPPASIAKIQLQLNKIAKKITKKNGYVQISVEPFKRKTPFLESYEIPEKNFYLLCLKRSIRKTLSKSPHSYFRTSVGDENVFAKNGIVALSFGPEGNNAHNADEWVSLSSLQKLDKIVGDLLTLIDKQYDLG